MLENTNTNNGAKPGMWIVYDDGRAGHTMAVAEKLTSDAVKMVVQRSNPTTVYRLNPFQPNLEPTACGFTVMLENQNNQSIPVSACALLRSSMTTSRDGVRAGTREDKMTKTEWTPSDTSKSIHFPWQDLEFQDNKGTWQLFTVIVTPERVVFGGVCNAGFIESGYILRDDCESLDETLQEMLSDLETYYNDGPQYVSRIVCNERM